MPDDPTPTPTPTHRPLAHRSPRRVRRAALAVLLLAVAALALALGAPGAEGRTDDERAAQAAAAVATTDEPTPEDLERAGQEMTAGKAILLGVVEGVTEFLPVSSTGHLLVAERLLDIGGDPGTEDVAKSYAIAIQAGAILAVLLLYSGRVRSILEGMVGRDEAGRTVLLGLVVAFLPAAVIGVAFESLIKDALLGTWQVIAAWIAWGVVVLLVDRRWVHRGGGVALEAITMRQGLLIGVAQCLAMWPGTSRSLVTILAALAVGLSLPAAVEFSFLLGLVTLGAATAYETVTNGATMIEAYGWVDPLLGLAAAFVSAAVAVKWMVAYLQHHSLAVFGWYRIAVGVLAAGLVWTGAM